MTEIQQARYDKLLRRVADLKGPGSKVSDALGDLFPTIDVELVPGELLLLGGTSLCIGAAIVTGAVGERARIQVFNPVGSGKIATVSTLLISNSDANLRARWAVNTTPLTTGAGTESFRDGRLATGARPACQIRTDSTVAITDANGIISLLNDVTFKLDDRNGIAVLSPGTGLEVGALATATEIVATFFWREREAQPSELNF